MNDIPYTQGNTGYRFLNNIFYGDFFLNTDLAACPADCALLNVPADQNILILALNVHGRLTLRGKYNEKTPTKFESV